ncbi:MAG: hypothetical protein KC646_16205 [Candidatus Cloacimonetes bacterium]|nr:hypothetical protein [Candidatus Cloacimonadota bacterium]
MILACPSCKRKFKIIEEYRGKLVRCKCQALLKVPGVFTDSNTPPPAIGKPDKSTPPEPSTNTSDEIGIWVELTYPQVHKPFDLSKWSAAEEDSLPEPDLPEEPEEEDLPSFDDDLPSFDDDEEEGISDDNIESLTNFDEPEEEITDDQQHSLDGINIQEEAPLDPRVIPALKDLETSEDPQFIIDFLFYLLDIKRVEIKDTVAKFVDNINPLASYYAVKILANIEHLESEEDRFKKDIEPINSKKLIKAIFDSTSQSKIQYIENALNTREYGAIPYIMTQLLLEKDEQVTLLILNRVGLMCEQKEVKFFAKFLQSRIQAIKLASIEGLGCIGGEGIIPHLIASLVDRDMAVVAAINEALKSSDKDDIASQIMSYLMNHDVFDKKGYIKILKENGTVNALRAIAWLLSDPKVGVTSLETIKEMEIADEEKTAVLQEYLSLSYKDSSFDNDLISQLEIYNPNFDRSRLISVNLFDDSYVSLVRLSPLFERDFTEDDSDNIIEAELIEIEVLPFKLSKYVATQVQELKDHAEDLQSHIKVKSSIPYIITTIGFYGFVVFLLFTSFFKGMGKSLSYMPGFFPKQFSTAFGGQLFIDPQYAAALNSTFITGSIAIFIAFLLGSSFALTQLKKGIFRIRILPTLPILIPSILIGFDIGLAKEVFQLNLAEIFIILAYMFPCISIFYIVYIRLFSIIPKSHYDICIELGADETSALKMTYGPSFQIATLYATLLSALYIFCSIAMTSYIHNDSSLGYVLFAKLQYFQGWLMLGTYLATVAIFIMGIVFVLELIFPIFALFPSTITRNFYQHPFYLLFKKSLMVWGALFYKQKIKKSKPEAPKADDTSQADSVDDDSDDEDDDEEESDD